MTIPDALLSSFAKTTNMAQDDDKEYYYYATVTNVTANSNSITVQLDGSDVATTPCTTSVTCKVNDRVMVSFKNREAVVVANVTTKSITVNELLAERVVTQELIVNERATIRELIVQDLKTDNIEIKGKLIGTTGTFNGKLVVTWTKDNQTGPVSIGDTSKSAPLVIDWEGSKAFFDSGRLYFQGGSGSSAYETMLSPWQLTLGHDYRTIMTPSYYELRDSNNVTVVQINNTPRIEFNDPESHRNGFYGINGANDGFGTVTHSSNGTVRNFRFLYNSDNVRYLEVSSTDASTSDNWGVTIWSSDRELKKDIEDTGVNAIDILMRIQHRKFKWKRNDAEVDIGYVAQELEEVMPEAVFKPEGGYCQINPNAIIPYLSKAIQEQQEKIESLEARIQRLEEMLNAKT